MRLEPLKIGIVIDPAAIQALQELADSIQWCAGQLAAAADGLSDAVKKAQGQTMIGDTE